MPPKPKRDHLFHDMNGLTRLWPYLKSDKGKVLIAAALVPVISLLQMALPIVLRHTIDEGTTQGLKDVILWSSLTYIALVIVEYLARATQTMVSATAVHRMIMRMRRTLMAHVLRLKASYHDQSLSGALVTRATSDFDNLSESLNQGVLSSVVDLAVLIGAVVGLFILNAKLALFTIVMLPFVWIFIHHFSQRLKQSMLAARVKVAALNGFLQECLYGANTVKLLTAETASGNKFGKLSREYRDAQMQSVILDAVMFAVLDGVATVTVGIVLWAAVGQVTVGVSVGMMVAFVQYIQNLFEPLKNLGNKIAMLQGAFTSLERIFGILDRQDFIKGDILPGTVQGDVQFQHVSFSYPRDDGRTTEVLKDLNFQIQRGQSLALVGPTGSGKSTIIKLFCRLYDGYTGTITLDGQDIRNLDGDALRQQMAIVPQDIVLFDGSIAFNISLNSPNVSRSDIERAVEAVGAAGFIASLPGGLDFEIKEQGANLSHGQRQLLVFARALAKNPRIVVLDEATSSVDPAAEQAIQQAIASLLQDRTVIVIAHRLSTIRRCDQILVIRGGEVVEYGNHRELMAMQGAYHLLSTQHIG